MANRLKKITSTGNDELPRGVRIMGARLVSAAADSVAKLFDEAGGVDGSEFCQLVVTKGGGESHPGSDEQIFDGGFFLNKALSVTLSGASAVLYIYYV